MVTKKELEQEKVTSVKSKLDRAKRSIDDYETMHSRVEQIMRERNGYVILFNINEDIKGLLSLSNVYFINREVTDKIQQIGAEIRFRIANSIRDIRQGMSALGEVRDRITTAQKAIENYQKELDCSLADTKLSEEKRQEIVGDLKKYLESNDIDVVNIKVNEDFLEGAEIEGNFKAVYDDFCSDTASDYLYQIGSEIKEEGGSDSELKSLIEERFGSRDFWVTVRFAKTLNDIKRLPAFEEYTETEKDAFLQGTGFYISTLITDGLVKELKEMLELD